MIVGGVGSVSSEYKPSQYLTKSSSCSSVNVRYLAGIVLRFTSLNYCQASL